MSGMFGHNDDATMHGEFMAFVADETSLLALRGWAERQGYPQATVQQGGADLFAHMLGSSAPPKLAIIDIDGQADPVATLTRLLSLCAECKIIAVGSANDVGLYRRILATGAVEYLVKPLTAETLNQALASALRGEKGGKADAKEARIMVFIGTRGGVGASTAALNTGWLLAHEYARTVALLDLDLQFGTSALSLDLEPGRGLRDIVSSPNRVDGLMIASSIVPESDNFSVLGAEEAVDEFVTMDGGAITALMKEMKSNFNAVLVDMPRSMLAGQKRLLAAAHEIVLISDLSLAGIRDTLRIKSAITALGCTARVSIVASRTNANGVGQIDRPVFEKGIQGKIDITIPEDATSLTAAANSGKALGEMAPKAAVTKALRDLAIRLIGTDAKPAAAKLSLWDKLKGKDKGARSKK